MTQKQPINQITEGVIWKQLLLFFFPILLGTFFQQLYNTIDTVIVGQFVGKAALASVGGSSAQIVALIVGFFTGLSSGASVLIAQYFGARNEHAASDGLHNAYAISIVGGILLGIIGFFATPSMLRLMNTPDEIMQDSVIYLRIYFAGIIFVFLYNMGSSILRAVGDSKGSAYHPEDRIQFSVGRPGGRSICSKGVDCGLNGDIGNGKQDCFESGRKSKLQLIFQDRSVEPDAGEGKL